jgi:ubiquinone/menaquinone biosynthesis C-methylase UbiE
MMGIYATYVLPRLTHLSMRQAQLRAYRERVVGGARGRVLEIGFGSGLNLPFYGQAVDEIIGVDASPEMLALAKPAIASSRHEVRVLARSADDLPLDDQSIDTIVVTWSLCSIVDVGWALMEARRVLRPGGQMRFVEHGLSPDRNVATWQNRLTPLWRRCAGGCHLNRKMDDLIRGGGFQLAELSTAYARGPRPMVYMYEGIAVQDAIRR